MSQYSRSDTCLLPTDPCCPLFFRLDPQSLQEFRGSASHELLIENPHIQKVTVVTDEMTRGTIDGTEKENCIVGINRIMPEVEETNFDTFRQKKETRDECFDVRRGVTFVEQLLRIFRCNISSDQPGKFTS